MDTNREPRSEPTTWDLVIVVDGNPPVPGWRHLVTPGATVIAADGGARHARVESVAVTDLVGDFDSLTPGEVDASERDGTRLHRFDVDKDFTDFELAAHLAHGRHGDDAAAILVVGGAGGRLDHALGAVAVLGGGDLAPFAVTALVGDAVVHVVTAAHPVTLVSPVGTTASILPLGGPVHGVTTHGLRFRLEDETLYAEGTRGISNEVGTTPARVTVRHGTALVIEPDAVRHLIDNRKRDPR